MVDTASGHHLGRYRCANLSCCWQGLLPRPPRAVASTQPVASTRGGRTLPWARLGGTVLAGALLLLAGVQVGRHMGAAPQPPQQLAQARALPPGEHHEGDLLPASHPWLRPVVLSAQDAASGASALGTPAQADPGLADVEPLALRRGCNWGLPGRNPYKGTVEQALLHARLPPEVVQEVSRKVKAREISDRLEIRTGRIHGVKHGAEFDPQRVMLSFGKSLCLNSRVNFPTGHVEAADLYEATDARGKRHAVMVPDVCGNVSVLGERGERRRSLMVRGVDGDMGADGDWELLATGAAPDEVRSVPEPGTLAAVLAALAALALLQHRQRRLRTLAVERSTGPD